TAGHTLRLSSLVVPKPGRASPIPPPVPMQAAPVPAPQAPAAPPFEPVPASQPAALLAGMERIGQYEIIRELGRGGMGVVYLARDDRLGRKVAIKLLQTGRPELTRRFITEARTTARCSHENIVVIYKVGKHQGHPFMVLEFLEGQTLASYLHKA